MVRRLISIFTYGRHKPGLLDKGGTNIWKNAFQEHLRGEDRSDETRFLTTKGPIMLLENTHSIICGGVGRLLKGLFALNKA